MSQATALDDTMKSLGGVNNLLSHANRESERFGAGATVISTIFQGLKLGAVGWALSLTSVGRHIRHIADEVKGLAQSPVKIDVSPLKGELLSIRRQQDEYWKEVRSGRMQHDKEFYVQLKLQGDAVQRELISLRRRNDVVDAYNRISGISMKWALAYGVALKTTLDVHQRMNEALIGTNSALTERSTLVAGMFSAWGATGASLEVVRGAASALVERGRDLTGTFKEDVVLVTQMDQGLRMSAHTGAELVTSFGQLKVNTRQVADGIARVVRDTALSADEAGRYASHLARAFAVMRPGASSAAAEVSEYLLRIEGRLKQSIGITGEIEGLYSRMATTAQGASLAKMLGFDPNKIASDPEAGRQITESIAKLVENSTRGMDQVTRLAALEAWSHRFGVSVQVLSQLSDAVNVANKPLSSQVTLQHVWQQETRNTGRALNQLVSSLIALGMQAFLPIVRVINMALTPVAKFIGILSEFKPLVKILQGLAIVALPFVIARTVQFSVALYNLALAMSRAAAASTAAAVAERSRAASLAVSQLTLPGFGGRVPLGGRIAGALRGTSVGTAATTALATKGIWGLLNHSFKMSEVAKSGWQLVRNGFTWLRPFMDKVMVGLRGITLATAAGAAVVSVAVGAAAFFISREGKKAVQAANQALKAQYGAIEMDNRLKATLMAQARNLASKGDFAGLDELQQRYIAIRGNKANKSDVMAELDQARRAVEDVAETKFQREVRNQHGQVTDNREIEHLRDLVAYSQKMWETNKQVAEQDRLARRTSENEAEKKRQEDRTRELLNHRPMLPVGY